MNKWQREVWVVEQTQRRQQAKGVGSIGRRLLRRRRAAQVRKAIAVKLEARYLITVHMS